uniref:Uncharacterized protein n=1 Tax=Timema douglasi TaxID=61478 RepID=A0A7R8VM91_TIMDO|nr:unnamed protein product [Timema douglasi]
MKLLIVKPNGKKPRKCEDNIRIDLKEIGCNEVDWLELTQDRDSKDSNPDFCVTRKPKLDKVDALIQESNDAGYTTHLVFSLQAFPSCWRAQSTTNTCFHYRNTEKSSRGANRPNSAHTASLSVLSFIAH